MTRNSPARERRSFHRLPDVIEVRYGASGEFRRASSCDISPIGIGLEGPALFPVGTELDLRFQASDTPRGDLVLLKAQVCHAGGRHMGLRFINVPKKEQAQVREFIAGLASAMPEESHPR